MEDNEFEKNIKSLEEIVKELEIGDLSLDDSIKKFDEGVKLSKKCNEELESAEKKITKLVEEDEKISETEFGN